MRVVGGRLRSRALVAPKGDATRPTTDRVRESLFAVLGDLHGAVVLDLYAGTGALAIEALSRGARRAVCVEHARPALAALEKNRASLGLVEELEVVARRVEAAGPLLVGRGPFDLVLADPPYADVADGGLVAALGPLLATAGVLADEALVVIERASRDAAPVLPGLLLEEERRWGDTAVSLHRRAPP